jgi:hypothetical protein
MYYSLLFKFSECFVSCDGFLSSIFSDVDLFKSGYVVNVHSGILVDRWWLLESLVKLCEAERLQMLNTKKIGGQKEREIWNMKNYFGGFKDSYYSVVDRWLGAMGVDGWWYNYEEKDYTLVDHLKRVDFEMRGEKINVENKNKDLDIHIHDLKTNGLNILPMLKGGDDDVGRGLSFYYDILPDEVKKEYIKVLNWISNYKDDPIYVGKWLINLGNRAKKLNNMFSIHWRFFVNNENLLGRLNPNVGDEWAWEEFKKFMWYLDDVNWESEIWREDSEGFWEMVKFVREEARGFYDYVEKDEVGPYNMYKLKDFIASGLWITKGAGDVPKNVEIVIIVDRDWET